ncbi:MAG: NADP-dependent malic enzyme [Flavobacteriales bacterium]|nr:NADP-dependent malic enzyme [Flavobacteriales bacterium]
MIRNKYSDPLSYHSEGRPGKIEVLPTKPTQTQRDLSLAYSPGVAEPCLKIAENIEDVYKYTAKGNLVAVISNGTAVLGLGNIGPEASKPVMEGKGLLFKIFADIDVFDIELNCNSVEEFVTTVKAMEPTFGGVNLEDIKAPECFEIEDRLKKELSIPIMHDDQHGTAIISGAALLNALEIVGKKINKVKMVINGAGASAISCGRLFVSLGVERSNIVMLDSKGVIQKNRAELDDNKLFFATERKIETLEQAMKDADIFVGLSKSNILSQAMIKSMAKKPIVFAMANPDPEIAYDLAVATRSDLIMATGRSDHPNQVNNVLGFPFIFRGALDVRATTINEEMKLAAVKAIAGLAHEPVLEMVNVAYNERNITFGKDYIIPKPIDPRLIYTVAPAVAKAAMDSGVARNPITDWGAYEEHLKTRLGIDDKFLSRIAIQAKVKPKRVVFTEADNYKILKAAQICVEDGTAIPILLGEKKKIQKLITENGLNLENVQIIDPLEEENLRKEYGQKLYEMRQRKGMTLFDCNKMMAHRNYFGTMMVQVGAADSVISGLTKNYPSTIRPALQVMGTNHVSDVVAGMYILLTKRGPIFLADTTINIDPSWENLVEIALLTYSKVKKLQVDPVMALLSYSNFGSAKGAESEKIRKAIEHLHKNYPEIVIDGDIQANYALNKYMREEHFPFSKLGNKNVNCFIFPNLTSGNIVYKMVQELGGFEAIGPVLMGLNKSVHILQLGSSVREIVNMVNIAVVDAQSKDLLNKQKP